MICFESSKLSSGDSGELFVNLQPPPQLCPAAEGGAAGSGACTPLSDSTLAYFHRVNGAGSCEPERGAGAATGAGAEAPLGGLFARLARLQGGPPRLPAFPVVFDMTSTKTLLAISRLNRGSRISRRKRTPGGSSGTTGGGGGAEHCPLDLSAGGESAAKRARLSASPSLKSDCDERDRASNDERLEARGECLCAEAQARLAAWTVDDVCDFVTSIDICAEYAPRHPRVRLSDRVSLMSFPAARARRVSRRRLRPATGLAVRVFRSRNGRAPCRSSVGFSESTFSDGCDESRIRKYNKLDHSLHKFFSVITSDAIIIIAAQLTAAPPRRERTPNERKRHNPIVIVYAATIKTSPVTLVIHQAPDAIVIGSARAAAAPAPAPAAARRCWPSR
ncbi:hypothetical protein EVAR_38351_1 [Eumeta japonica]|uniref:Uncharacterized protein n=1 Tax=Eumeta variegata TaxID=151549 RepID=A0A4C1XXN7_EUMVA|nr:hypothetical protein EVAR_38351_1 [Eumeta japonica]